MINIINLPKKDKLWTFCDRKDSTKTKKQEISCSSDFVESSRTQITFATNCVVKITKEIKEKKREKQFFY